MLLRPASLLATKTEHAVILPLRRPQGTFGTIWGPVGLSGLGSAPGVGTGWHPFPAASRTSLVSPTGDTGVGGAPHSAPSSGLFGHLAQLLEANPPQFSHWQVLCCSSQLALPPVSLPAGTPAQPSRCSGPPPTGSMTYQDVGAQATPSTCATASPRHNALTSWEFFSSQNVPGASVPRGLCTGCSFCLESLPWAGGTAPLRLQRLPSGETTSCPQTRHPHPVGQFWKISPPGVISICLWPGGPQVPACLLCQPRQTRPWGN